MAPLDAATAQLFDVNGGLLPITGTVTLTVRVGTYSTPVTCWVVRGMSVPLRLGTDYTDVHVPNICGPKGYVRLLNGCRVPILVGVRRCRMPGRNNPRLMPLVRRTPRCAWHTRWSYPRGPGDTFHTDVIRGESGHHSAPSSV